MSDNKQTINCPACGKEMVKVFDKEKGINIDICLNGCGGIFFDNREFEKFVMFRWLKWVQVPVM